MGNDRPIYMPKLFGGGTLLRAEEIWPEHIMALLWDSGLKRFTYQTNGIDESWLILKDLKDIIIYHIQRAQRNRYHDRVSEQNALRLWAYMIYSEQRLSPWRPPGPNENEFREYHSLHLHADIWSAVWAPLAKKGVQPKFREQIFLVAESFLKHLLLLHPCRWFSCREECNSSKCCPSANACPFPDGCCQRDKACWGKWNDQYSDCNQSRCACAPNPAWLAGLAVSLCGIDDNYQPDVEVFFEKFFASEMAPIRPCAQPWDPSYSMYEQEYAKDHTNERDTARLLAWFIWADALRESGALPNYPGILDKTFMAFGGWNPSIHEVSKFSRALALAHQSTLDALGVMTPAGSRMLPEGRKPNGGVNNFVNGRLGRVNLTDTTQTSDMRLLIGKTISLQRIGG